MSEVILVGGSKDGLVTDGVSGLQAVHNIVLNDTKDGPEYIDRYVPANVEDKDGRAVYVHVGRYDSEESRTYWDRLAPEDIADLVAAAEEAEKAEAEAKAEEEAKAAEESKTKEAPAEESTTEESKEVEQDAETGEAEASTEETKEETPEENV